MGIHCGLLSLLCLASASTTNYYNWAEDHSQEYQDYGQNQENIKHIQNEGGNVEKSDWVTVLSQAWSSPERTIDLSSLGIDLGTVFDRLLSPAGIVNQFALSLTIQLIFIIGYVVSGLGYGLLLARTPAGPLLDALSYFDVHLSPQAIFTTVARSSLSLVWELAARSITTAFLFGVFESVSQISATTSLQSVWSFITDQTIKEITLWRFVFGTIFVFIAFPILVTVANVGNLEAGREFKEESYFPESYSYLLK
eukprot:TRINITY_DN12244_c0_g1_i2.p1 TRINITY_DN12244_c0_g1~~TRINITY_DN12244_c0_g1_i2.p1  ORF type:complete len:253 (-),score=57.91 TRINITY_DN12244_c0_g1_i2:23-781(-)